MKCSTKQIWFLSAFSISILSLSSIGYSTLQPPFCDNKEIARSYSSKNVPELSRYLRFFRNQTQTGYELKIRDCPNSNADGFPAIFHISYGELQQALGKILSAKAKRKTQYNLMLFSDIGIFDALFIYLVDNFRPTNCEQEDVETFSIDMYEFQIDNELTGLFPGHSPSLFNDEL
jgi:hypothetical protein